MEVLLALVRNLDVLAWSPNEVPGLDSAFIVQWLNVNSSIVPKKQKPKRSMKPHVEAVIEEVRKLKQAGAIKEVFFSQVVI